MLQHVEGPLEQLGGCDVLPVDHQPVRDHGVAKAEGGRGEDVVEAGVAAVVVGEGGVQAVLAHCVRADNGREVLLKCEERKERKNEFFFFFFF